jgi:tetratricopeptide (TPR) repeat protein
MATAQDYKERGNAYYNRQEYDEAVSCYAKAVDLDPTNHAVYTNRAAGGAHPSPSRPRKVCNVHLRWMIFPLFGPRTHTVVRVRLIHFHPASHLSPRWRPNVEHTSAH